MTTWVALLRGVNVGGITVRSADLAALFRLYDPPPPPDWCEWEWGESPVFLEVTSRSGLLPLPAPLLLLLE